MSEPTVKDGWRRHLEGWQAGLLALSIAGVGLLLGAPRDVEPRELPLPVPDGRVLKKIALEDRELSRALEQSSEAEKTGPNFHVRALGALLRKYNGADAAGERDEMLKLREDMLRAAGGLHTNYGDDGLLKLRAFHLQIFLREIARYEATGEETAELREVAGAFVELARSSGWVSEPHKLLPDHMVLSALFKRRFAEVLGLGWVTFMLKPDEARALYGFFFAHPRTAVAENGARVVQWDWLLRKSEELSLLDDAYPGKLARGVALYRLGDYRGAGASFKAHLAAHQDGPHTLRARNYLKAAIERVRIEP